MILCWMVLLGLRLLHHSTRTADAFCNKSLILFNLLQFSVYHISLVKLKGDIVVLAGAFDGQRSLAGV